MAVALTTVKDADTALAARVAVPITRVGATTEKAAETAATVLRIAAIAVALTTLKAAETIDAMVVRSRLRATTLNDAAGIVGVIVFVPMLLVAPTIE